MDLQNIDKILKENEIILLDKSSICFSFDINYPHNLKEKIAYRKSRIKTLKYWLDVFHNSLDDFKFYIPELAVKEIYYRDGFNYIKSIKTYKGDRDILKYFRKRKEEKRLFYKVGGFFWPENIFKFKDDDKIFYNQLKKASQKKINAINLSLKEKNKYPLSDVDIDYYLTAFVLSSKQKKVSIITNDVGLYHLCSKTNFDSKKMDFDVYIHRNLGKFLKYN